MIGLLRVGLAGHRSFIAKALAVELCAAGVEVIPLAKDRLGTNYLLGLDCVYLILGRDRPSSSEAAAELRQVTEYVGNPVRCARTLYLSSRLNMPHKGAAEALITSVDGLYVRPPAVFGPGQRVDSEMLIPSLVRTAGTVELCEPQRVTDFIPVAALAVQLASLADPAAWNAAKSLSTHELALSPWSTLRATPSLMRDLYLAFKDLADAWDDRGVGC